MEIEWNRFRSLLGWLEYLFPDRGMRDGYGVTAEVLDESGVKIRLNVIGTLPAPTLQQSQPFTIQVVRYAEEDHVWDLAIGRQCRWARSGLFRQQTRRLDPQQPAL